DGVALAEEASQGGFELLVQVLGAADEAYRGQAVAVAAQSLVGRLDQGGVVGQPEVVVGAEVDDLAAADGDAGALGPLQLALALVQPLGAQVVELRLQHLQEVLVAHGVSPGGPRTGDGGHYMRNAPPSRSQAPLGN